MTEPDLVRLRELIEEADAEARLLREGMLWALDQIAALQHDNSQMAIKLLDDGSEIARLRHAARAVHDAVAEVVGDDAR